METEIDVLARMLEIQLVQPAGSCKLSPPPLPTRTPSFHPLFHIPLLHLPNNLPPRGINQSRLLLLITHGPQKRSSCLEKWDRAEQEVQQQLRSLAGKRSLIKSFKLLGRQKTEGWEEVWERISLRFRAESHQNYSFSLNSNFLSLGPNLARPSTDHLPAGRPGTVACLTRVPRGTLRNPFERQIHWSFWLDCLVYGFNDRQFDSWQIDTDWSIGA